jgi:hypothetical protein
MNVIMSYSEIREVWNAFWKGDVKNFDRRKAKVNIAVAQSKRILDFLSLYKIDDDDIIIPRNVWMDLEKEINSGVNDK